MKLDWAGEIDSACTCCGASDTVDWVQAQDGTRRYACRSCLEDLLRTDSAPDSLADLADTPDALKCRACSRLTLHADLGPANRCPECAPDDNQEALEQAATVLAEGEQPEG